MATDAESDVEVLTSSSSTSGDSPEATSDSSSSPSGEENPSAERDRRRHAWNVDPAERERLESLGGRWNGANPDKKTSRQRRESQWLRTTKMAERVLGKMEEQPDRYDLLQRLAVQAAIATISDEWARIPDRQKAVQDILRIFGTFGKSKDDPFKEDTSKVSAAEKEAASSSTKDLLNLVRGPNGAGSPKAP